MIRITVELVPHGIEERATVIGIALIANDGSGSLQSGNYHTSFSSRDGKVWKTGKVKNFPRKRRLVWDLLYRALKGVIGARNDKEMGEG